MDTKKFRESARAERELFTKYADTNPLLALEHLRNAREFDRIASEYEYTRDAPSIWWYLAILLAAFVTIAWQYLT